MIGEPSRFWMVYGIGGGRPTYQHETYESAMAEAKRLARENLENTFVVLEAIASVCKTEFVTVTFRAPTDDIPF